MSKVKMISPEVKNVPWQEKPEGLKGAPIWKSDHWKKSNRGRCKNIQQCSNAI